MFKKIANLTAFAGTLLISAGAIAAAPPSYVAELASPSTSTRLVSSEKLWSCQGVLCAAAGPADSAARRICSRLVREVGPLKSFSARGRSFDQTQLAACNASAAPAAPVMAAQ